jgi:hypothetical protein
MELGQSLTSNRRCRGFLAQAFRFPRPTDDALDSCLVQPCMPFMAESTPAFVRMIYSQRETVVLPDHSTGAWLPHARRTCNPSALHLPHVISIDDKPAWAQAAAPGDRRRRIVPRPKADTRLPGRQSSVLRPPSPSDGLGDHASHRGRPAPAEARRAAPIGPRPPEQHR